jgi:dihydroorotase
MTNKSSFLIHDGHIIDTTQGIDEIGDLLIIDGRISPLFDGGTIPRGMSYTALDARGLIICPGFIDLHCHLRQPGSEEKETIITGSRAAAKGGFTTICCMPNTNPPLDNIDTIEYVKNTAIKEGLIRILPIACVSKGRKGVELVEMDKLVVCGVIGFSDDGDPVKDSRLMGEALKHSKELCLPIIDHCEDTSLTHGGHMNEGIISTKLNLRGMPAVAEDIIINRDLMLNQLTSGWLHIAHVSTGDAVKSIRRAKEKSIKVTAEVTPHHLTLTEERVLNYNTNAKVNPPLRTQQDTQDLIQGLKEGIIDVIATDHAPHTKADKLCDFGKASFGISNFETTLGSLMNLIHSNQLDLSTLIAKLTSGPAKILGDRYGKLGSLSAGTLADITIFDPQREWIVDTQQFVSKGKNTPLNGEKLRGKVMATIYQGKLIYKDDSIELIEITNGDC